jgi:hypothetical protein
LSFDWSAPVSDEVAAARAAGRRHYNAVRHLQAELRRGQVLELLMEHGFFSRGIQRRIARHLGVSRATICKDVRAILEEGRLHPCPTCGSMVE